MPIVIVIILVLYISVILASISAASTGSSVTIPNFSLIFIGVLGSAGILTFVGIILFVIAMHRLSQYYNEPGIYKNALYGFILNTVGGIAGIAIEFVFIIGSLGSTSQTGTLSTTGAALMPLIVGLVAVSIVSFVLAIISAVLYMRAFNALGEKSGSGSFKTAGLLYLLGIVLTIVLVGVLLSWIAWIYAAMGFSSLKQKEPPLTVPPPP
jgi:uncharacterized membrane protein